MIASSATPDEASAWPAKSRSKDAWRTTIADEDAAAELDDEAAAVDELAKECLMSMLSLL
jgi:hypothetical protein